MFSYKNIYSFKKGKFSALIYTLSFFIFIVIIALVNAIPKLNLPSPNTTLHINLSQINVFQL
jgi:hypothetical protein